MKQSLDHSSFQLLLVLFPTSRASSPGSDVPQQFVANKLRLLRLITPVQTAILDHRITERHGRALLDLDEKQHFAGSYSRKTIGCNNPCSSIVCANSRKFIAYKASAAPEELQQGGTAIKQLGGKVQKTVTLTLPETDEDEFLPIGTVLSTKSLCSIMNQSNIG